MKLYYDFKDANVGTNVEDIFELNKRPKWFLDTSPIIFGEKNQYEFLSKCPYDVIGNNETFSTVRSCPGVNRHFSNSLLIKFPADVWIDIGEDGWFHKCSNRDIEIGSHSIEQAPNYLGENWHIFRFDLNITLRCEYENKAIYVNPLMWKKQDYYVSPGVWQTGDESGPDMLNILCLFNKDPKKYYFKKGEPIAVMQFFDKISSIEYEDHSHFFNKRARGGVKSFFGASHKK